jgi:hypothetical protein
MGLLRTSARDAEPLPLSTWQRYAARADMVS